MSPQILKRQQYTSKCDIWSLGLILYEMIYGQTPWHSTNLVELMQKLDSQPLSFPVYPQISDDCRQVIKMCLQISEVKRINWPQLFNHPFCAIPKLNQTQIHQQLKEITIPIQNNSSLISTQRQIQKELPLQQQPTSSKHRSNSNAIFNMEEPNKRSFKNYLENTNNNNNTNNDNINLPRVKTEYDRERSHSQVNFWKYNTQKIEIPKEIENHVTTPIIQPQKKYSSNNDSRTPSAMQSQSTNASKGMDQEVKINEFKIPEEKEEPKTLNRIFGQYQRIKRTNSMTTRLAMPKLNENNRTPINTLLKVISNQQDLIPNHITLKNDIGQMLNLHKKLLNSSNDQIFNSDDQQMVQNLIKKLSEFIKINEADHFLVQVQVMLLLISNYKDIIDWNILTGQLNLTQTILDLIQKNQGVQQNQLQMNQKTLNQQIKQQIRI